MFSSEQNQYFSEILDPHRTCKAQVKNYLCAEEFGDHSALRKQKCKVPL